MNPIMKAVADVIVRKRKLVITLMLLLTAVCVYCMTKVEVVTDMTRYLPEKSAMKQGMDVMGEAFPTVETENTIRVLFHDLSEEEKTTIAEKLSTLTYASGVDYVPQSEAYNKDQYTLFVVRTVYGYGSKEEKQLERMIRKEFQDHAPEVMNDSPMVSELQFSAIAIALAILFLILFVMSGSWFETILFLITIGIAVGINLGTNLFQGSVSNITHMIAAILQLVLLHGLFHYYDGPLPTAEGSVSEQGRDHEGSHRRCVFFHHRKLGHDLCRIACTCFYEL